MTESNICDLPQADRMIKCPPIEWSSWVQLKRNEVKRYYSHEDIEMNQKMVLACLEALSLEMTKFHLKILDFRK